MTFYRGNHEFDNGVDDTSNGRCAVEEWNKHLERLVPCGNEWTSVVHPPDQFRHWCGVLEAGGDCMHMEGY